MKLFSFALTLLLLAGAVRLVQPVRAQTASPSAELREIIRQRLESTLEVDTSDRLIGVVGSVTRVTASTFTLVDPIGRERTVIIDPETTTFAGTVQVRTMSDVAIDSGVAVIGSSTDGVLINARRIIPSATPFAETRRVALGSVQIFERNILTLTERGNGSTTSVNILPTTRFEDILGNTVPRTSVQEDEAILVVIDRAANGTFFAKRVRLLVAANAE